MAMSETLESRGASGGDPGTPGRTLPRKAIYIAVAVAVAYAALLLFCEIGTDDAERIANPDPPPASDPQTFMGVRDKTWFPILYFATALVLASMLTWLVRHWRRTGRVHPAAAVLLAFTTFAVWDPLINWATFTVFSPDMIHYPVDWWWWNMSPVIETPWAWGGYGLFYITPMLAGFWFWRTYVTRTAQPDSWIARHPLLSIWIFGSVFGAVVDIPAELFLINMNVWHYWQHWGPAIEVGNATLPCTEIFWTGMLIGTGMLLLHPDDKGRSQFAVAASRRPLAQRLRLGEKTMAVLLLTAVYAGYLGTFSAIRVLDGADHVEDEWPISTAKVYDPYGDAKDAGIPGPYFEGVGAWSVR